MKILFIILALVILSNCVNQTSAFKNENISATPSPTVDNSNNVNANSWKPIPNEADKIDQAKRQELEIQNEKFRIVPEGFRSVDFKNFEYPSVRLKNGVYEEADNYTGGTTFRFDKVFFIDLAGDEKKEAIVLLNAVSCGGSCDGGSLVIHIYSSQKGKARLIDFIELGSRSGGCSLKSLTIKDRKIHIEQFGKCAKNSKYEENRVHNCKFCVRDLTRSVYSIKNSQLVRESVEQIETPETDVMNYSSEISINE
jgi:hypothetical protein